MDTEVDPLKSAWEATRAHLAEEKPGATPSPVA
jgi:hypothetical protein